MCAGDLRSALRNSAPFIVQYDCTLNMLEPGDYACKYTYTSKSPPKKYYFTCTKMLKSSENGRPPNNFGPFGKKKEENT